MEQPLSKLVFISYANEAMAYSLKRIGRQARKLGIFDEVGSIEVGKRADLVIRDMHGYEIEHVFLGGKKVV